MKIAALALGWREAWDYDEQPKLLVVYHPDKSVHFTGPDAWRKAVRSILTRNR